MLMHALLVGIGGFAGSIARYFLSLAILQFLPSVFPAGTFVANIIGCLLIGVCYGCVDRYAWFSRELLIFLTVGFCGGFTTFSSFTLENIKLLEAGQYFTLALYAAGSIILGLIATFCGIALIK